MNSPFPQTSAAHGASEYRRDVDGLRAIAVLAVVGFHAGIVGFRGGFAGVDVFFVISGYLIGGIIFRELDAGKFSFQQFYVRRINRIFPALIIVLTASALMGWLFMLPNELTILGKHIIGGSTFSSNFILWKEYGYFDLPDKPLLHLWSLAVEEQFYLFFPVVALLLAFLRVRRRGALILLASLSFIGNVWAVRHSQQNAAFFLPYGRMWEILTGVLIADLGTSSIGSRDQYRPKRRRFEVVAPAMGLLLIVGSVVALDERLPWPGLFAALPVFGTAMIIIGDDRSIANRILSHRVLVAIGLISYPLYLWHWPLLVFGKLVNEGPLPLRERLILVALAFALAAFTFKAIERPIRFGKRKRRSAAALTPALAAVGLFGFGFNNELIFARLETGEARAQRLANREPEMPRDGTIDGGRRILFAHLPGDTSKTVALVGDSHMQQYWPRFVALRRESKTDFPEIRLLVYGGCPPIPQINRKGVSWDKNPWNCPGVVAAQYDAMMKPSVKTVVLSGFWEDYFKQKLLYPQNDSRAAAVTVDDPRLAGSWTGLENAVQEMVKAGKKVFIVLPGPVSRKYSPGVSYNNLPYRLQGFGRDRTPRRSISKRDILELTRAERAKLREIASRANAAIIDPLEFLCDGNECRVTTPDGTPIFRDDNHLRPGFVREYLTYMDKVLR